MSTTAQDIKQIVALAAGRWHRDAQVIASDLPGVSFLRLPLGGGTCIEVYEGRRAFGAASVIVGNTGHLITPTEQMRASFRVNGCTSLLDA